MYSASEAYVLIGSNIFKLKEREKQERGKKSTPGLYLSGRFIHLVIDIFDFLFKFFEVI